LLPGRFCVKSLAPDHPNLTVTKIQGAPHKLRKSYIIAGFSPNVKFEVYQNNLTAVERALKERVFYVSYNGKFEPAPRPDPSHFNTTLVEVFKFFKKFATTTAPMEGQQFVDSYRGRKRAIYQKAWDTLIVKPISVVDSFLSSFMKCEKYNFTKSEDPVPRIIQPPNPRYNVEVGRFIRPIEKKLYQLIDLMFGSPTIFKGYNALERGKLLYRKWSRFKNPVAIGLDAKRFDQHVSVTALKWEHSIYKLFFSNNKYLSQMLDWQLSSTGYINCRDGTAKYKVKGGRWSGVMNTSSGNCLLMSSMVFSYAKYLGIELELANDGDDCVVIIEAIHLERFTKGVEGFFIKLGFKLTVEEPVYMFEKIDFCQCRPVFVDGEYIMIRDPNVAISKTSVAIKPLDNPSIFKMWCAAVGEGGLSLTGGVPVWQSFYNKLYLTANGAKKLVDPTMKDGMYYLSRGMDRKFGEISDATRVSFYHAFGIMPDIQIALEEYYNNVSLAFGVDNEQLRYVDIPLGLRQ